MGSSPAPESAASLGTGLSAAELPAPPVPEGPSPTHRDDHAPTSLFESPRTPLEVLLVDLWSDALAVTPLGIHDDFFEMGGHSLMAAQLITDIQEAVGCEVTARALFLQPTVAELAEVIATSLTDAASALGGDG